MMRAEAEDDVMMSFSAATAVAVGDKNVTSKSGIE